MTTKDRVNRVSRRRLNFDESSSDRSVTSEPNTQFDNHMSTSNTHMAQQPTPAQWQEMQRINEEQRLELENLR